LDAYQTVTQEYQYTLPSYWFRTPGEFLIALPVHTYVCAPGYFTALSFPVHACMLQASKPSA
jgi:hypothetical protein